MGALFGPLATNHWKTSTAISSHFGPNQAILAQNNQPLGWDDGTHVVATSMQLL